MKKKWKQKVAVVMTAVLCSLNPLACTEIRAEINTNEKTEISVSASTASNAAKENLMAVSQEKTEEDIKAETRAETGYTEQGQTILCLDKGSIKISEKSVYGYDKDGKGVYKVNEKGYYITVSEKGADTSGKEIDISKVSNVSLADIHGGTLRCHDVEKLTINGEVVLDAPFSLDDVLLLQGEGENAVFDTGKCKISSLVGIQISDLQVKASEVEVSALKLENSTIYADIVSSRSGMVLMDIGTYNNIPGVIECIGSSIYASKCFKTYHGRIENSTIETPEFSMDVREIEASAFQGMNIEPKLEVNQSNIKADEIRIWGIADVDFMDSEIKTEEIYTQTGRVNIIKHVLSGYGEDKTTERKIVDFIDDDVKLKFNHCKVTTESEKPTAVWDEKHEGCYISNGLTATGGTYDEEKKEYSSKALCEITIENGSEFVFKRPISLNDFVNLNIDGSTLYVEAHWEGEDDFRLSAISGNCSDEQKHVQVKLADNVMVADGKDILWTVDGDGRWYLDSVFSKSNPKPTDEIKIILKNGNSGNGNSENPGGTGNTGNSAGSSSSGSSGGSRRSSTGSSNSEKSKELPSYVVKGNWILQQDGNWSFSDANGNTYKNQWAVAYNPYANSAAGQEEYDWFYFDSNGNMLTGWIADADGNYYYLNPLSDGTRGRMLTGWVWIADASGVQKCYYLNPLSDGYRGKMMRNTMIEGSMVNEEGCWVENGVVQTK